MFNSSGQKENHSQSSKITQDYTLEHGTVSALSLVPGRIRDLEEKDLIIKRKNIWYITGGMDPGPAPVEKRDHFITSRNAKMIHTKALFNHINPYCKITFLIAV